MKARTRLMRERVRHMRSAPARPTHTRLTLPGGRPVRVVLAVTDDPHEDMAARYFYGRGTYADMTWGAFPPTPDTLAEIAYHASVTCWTCEGYGWVEIFHPSTDAVTGSRDCPHLADPVRHPPRKPRPAPARTLPAGCTAAACDGNPMTCCTPF